MRLLVLGSMGQLGQCLREELEHSSFQVIYSSRQDIDITDLAVTSERIRQIKPTVILNLAAYTAVDAAEGESFKAFLLNETAVKNIAEICREVNIGLLHLSTNYVFDGTASGYYTEDDAPSALGAYARSKLNGECAIRASGCRHMIIRTSWVFSKHGNNFLKKILQLAKEDEPLKLVSDQYGCPTYGKDIATAILAAVPALNDNHEISEVYHFCGDKALSWYDLGVEIFSRAHIFGAPCPKRIQKITVSNFNALARRPENGALNSEKFRNRFGVFPTPLRDALDETFKALLR